jgi:hypothetical protein
LRRLLLNGWWMAALAALALGEQIAPQEQLVPRVVGGAFLVVGLSWLSVLL